MLDGNIRLAFSPNGDGNKDVIQYRSVFYRNVNNLTAMVQQMILTTSLQSGKVAMLGMVRISIW